MTENADRRAGRPRPPLQFGLKGLLLLTAAVAALFGALRWLGISPFAGVVVLAILVVGAAAALGLAVAIAAAADRDD
jgi:hypothetical protein